MNPLEQLRQLQTRRHFLSKGKHLLGGAALATLLGQAMVGKASAAMSIPDVRMPHFPAKAKRVIYLHMVGGPSQMDLFDYKPKMDQWYDKELPESIRKGQRLTTMTSGQKRFPIAPSKYSFKRRGECGMWMNDKLLPWLGNKADEICWMRSMHTEAINHEPAIAAMQTGNEITGHTIANRSKRSPLGSGGQDTCRAGMLESRSVVKAIRFCLSTIRTVSQLRFASDRSMGLTVLTN